MRKPIITFDCDGVLAHFTKKFTEMVNDRFGTNYSPDWPSYAPDMQLDHMNAGFQMVQTTEFFWMMLEPCDNVPFKKIADMLFNDVFTGYVVSRRSSGTQTDAAAQTRYWLNGRGLINLQGVIVGNQDRSTLLHLLDCDAHLDDYGDQVLQLRDSGINAYLIDRPWNQDTKINPEFRVKSVSEFLERVVGEMLPAEVRKSYFPTPTEVLATSDSTSPQEIAGVIRDTGFTFSSLPESRPA